MCLLPFDAARHLLFLKQPEAAASPITNSRALPAVVERAVAHVRQLPRWRRRVQRQHVGGHLQHAALPLAANGVRLADLTLRGWQQG